MMSERTTRRVALAVVVFTAALTLANIILPALGYEALDNPDADLFFGIISTIGSLLYVGIGLLIAVRARNVIGWYLVVVGLSYGLLAFGTAYGAAGIVTFPGSLPAAVEVSMLLGNLWIVALVSLTLILLLFPNGRPPSPRWRPVLWMTIGGAAASYILFLVKPAPIEPVVGTTVPNPFAIESLSWFTGPALVAAAWVTVIGVVGCFAGLIVRFRHGDAELRQQIKWLGLVAAVGAACLLTTLASLVACSCDETGLGVVMFILLFIVILAGVPAAIAVALFKYRLYDLDLVVSKALVYGILAALFTLVYVALVIGIGTVVGDRGNSFLTIADRGRDRGRVPAGARTRPAPREPHRVRQARDAVRGPVRVLGQGRHVVRRRGRPAADGADPRERDRRELGPRVAAVRRGAPSGRVVAGERFGSTGRASRTGVSAGSARARTASRSATSASSSARSR